MRTLGVVILNWNGYHETKKCLDSILNFNNTSALDINFFLIDNNSTDLSGVKLEKEFGERVHFFNTGFNSGYTGGNNFGIVKAIQGSCNYVLILNNDLEIINFNAIVKSIDQVFQSSPIIGILGFDIFDYKSKIKQKSNGRSSVFFNYLLDIKGAITHLDKGVSFESRMSVCGCAICFKVDCISRIGLFDESFFMYAEEHDICLRAIHNKWNVVQITNKYAWIYRKMEVISSSQLQWYYASRNIFYAYKNNLRPVHIFIFSFVQLTSYVNRIIFLIFKKEFKIVKKIFTGVYDGLFRKKL
jgi:GT2 family glycosyltransferase